ncbi:beta-lactamase family protein [Carboxylicivirga sp. A043]|uniref:serine hydrolase domain-containing protein n=1 Tax=Carboxylicivirga litoralis TaxID=2816963 RepID=UPI0021CB55E6|nr:serine hydrolase domain-containing protein [Carboxylicivirga sp. A043]MCU4157397.1 beta-lactamase family protein [Carboxylicivirga sp. A043]
MSKKRSKQIIRILLLLGTTISMFYVPWPLLKALIKPMPGTVQEQVDEALEHGFDGIIVYVDKAGEPPAYYAAGWHDPKNKIPANPHALFKIASISKLYSAVAVAKLVHKGQVSLDDKLSDLLPELRGRIEYADQISLKMLVQHRSGIPNYTDTPLYWVAPKETNEDNLALVLDLPANFKPGENYEYCNTNYLLLSEIMDKVLGYPHFQFIQTEVLKRLNLTNTYASLDGVDMDRVMSGYHVGYPLDLKTEKVGMVASAEDVGVFLRALNDGTLFDGEEQAIYSSIYVYEHTGLVPGYQSIARYYKDIDAVVVQFTGPTYFEGYNWNLADIIYGRIVKIIRKRG